MSDDGIFHKQIKAAQRDLIREAGGIDRAARETGYGTSTVGRWNNPSNPEHMPLSAVRVLERDTGKPLITTIMAQETGCKISEPNATATDAGALDQLIRALVGDVMDLAGRGTVATSDNHVSPAEASTLENPAARAREALRQIEKMVATYKAAGGGPADLRLGGE